MPRYIGHNIDYTTSRVMSNTKDPSNSLLLDFNGNLTDRGHAGRTMTAENGAAVSTTQTKFGTHSLSGNGSTHHITAVNSADFRFGSGDFTIECWFYPTTIGRIHGIASQLADGARGWFMDITSGNKLRLYGYVGSWQELGISTTSVTVNNWHHLAVTRDGNNFRVFLNGVLEDTTVVSGSFTEETSNVMTVGYASHSGGNQYLLGFIDDFRITKGSSRYTATFAVPTAAHDTRINNVLGNSYNSGVWSISGGGNETVNNRRQAGLWAASAWSPGAKGAYVTRKDTAGATAAVPAVLRPNGGSAWGFESLDFDEAGYYQILVGASPITFDMWSWGGAGGAHFSPAPNSGGPVPEGAHNLGHPGTGHSVGGAAGGVRGRKTFSAGDTITVLVAQGGVGRDTVNHPPGSETATVRFPDGGEGSTNSSGGGGSSRIAATAVPFANINAAPTVYLLIGSGGGGSSAYTFLDPAYGMAGGYPTGLPGGGSYPSEPGAYGQGGTQSAGGAQPGPGRTGFGEAGAKYDGGSGQPNRGGGGGGGYYGGSAGAGYYTNGGGGSSYINPAVSSSANFHAAVHPGTFWKAVDDSSNPGTKPATAGEPYYVPSAGAVIEPSGTYNPQLTRAGFVKLKVV